MTFIYLDQHWNLHIGSICNYYLPHSQFCFYFYQRHLTIIRVGWLPYSWILSHCQKCHCPLFGGEEFCSSALKLRSKVTPGVFYASDFSLMEKEGTKPTSDNVYLSCHTEPTPPDDKSICHVSRPPRCYATQQFRWKMRCDWLRDVPLNVWASVLLKSSLTFLCLVCIKSGLLWFDGLDVFTRLANTWKHDVNAATLIHLCVLKDALISI